MEIPRYLQILWQYKWLLAVGLVVSVIVGVVAGYRVDGGRLVSRAPSSYSSSVTLLLGSEREPLFTAVIPGQEVPAGSTAPVRRDLAATAVVYAYLITSSEVGSLIEDRVGVLGESESVTALRRTTQPGGDERFPGRYDLPILDVVAFSDDGLRAQEIAGAAGDVFVDYVLAQQDAGQVAQESRVALSVISRGEAEQLEGSNPLVPVVVAGFGVFVVFVVFVFVVNNWRTTRGPRGLVVRAAAGGGPARPGRWSPRSWRRRAAGGAGQAGEPAGEAGAGELVVTAAGPGDGGPS